MYDVVLGIKAQQLGVRLQAKPRDVLCFIRVPGGIRAAPCFTNDGVALTNAALQGRITRTQLRTRLGDGSDEVICGWASGVGPV